MHEFDYSIIIPAFNEEELLPATLERLNQIKKQIQNYSGEIIVVDNNSTDNTANIAKDAKVKVIFEPFNQISKARNAGGNAAKGKILIFLDADTLLSKELILETLHTLEQENICGGSTKIQLDTVQNKAIQRTINIWNRISKIFRLTAGAYIYCLRSAFLETGGFSSKVYAGEDVLFGQSIKKWGKKQTPKLKTKILTIPIITSARKMEWYSNWQLLKVFLRLFFNPWTIQSKEKLDMWYKRPNSKNTDSESSKIE